MEQTLYAFWLEKSLTTNKGVDDKIILNNLFSALSYMNVILLVSLAIVPNMKVHSNLISNLIYFPLPRHFPGLRATGILLFVAWLWTTQLKEASLPAW